MFNWIKIINYLFLIISVILSVILGFWGVAVYSILAISLLIYLATRHIGVTEYIKREYPELYGRKKLINRMTLSGNNAVNLFSLTKHEISSFSDAKVSNYIFGIRKFIKSIIISFVLVLLVTICIYYLGD